MTFRQGGVELAVELYRIIYTVQRFLNMGSEIPDLDRSVIGTFIISVHIMETKEQISIR